MSGDVVWLDVLPAMANFATNLAKESTKAAQDAGKKAGTAWSQSLGQTAGGGAALVADLQKAERDGAKTVSTLSGRISEARAAERSAPASVLLAEAKLNDARTKYGQDSVQAQAAELKLAAARDKAEAATKKYAGAEDALQAAQREHTEVAGQLEKATKDLADQTDKQPSRWAAFKASMLGGAEGADKAKESLRTLALGAVAVGAALVTAVTAAGTGLYKVGQTFDDVQDTIRIGTGATGQDLAGLTTVAKQVGANVPVEFSKIGPAVADLNTRLGLSGDVLQTVASQYLEAGRMLGTDVDVRSTSAAFSAFKISGEGVINAMDTLFRVSQATGVGMNDLATSVANQAPALQNLGFGYADTVSLVGALDKAGIDADTTLAAMGKGLVNLARAGEQPQTAFRRVTGEIADLVGKGKVAQALDLASGVFGVRAANQFVGAVQSGTLALDDLTAQAGASNDTILGVAADTADFAETWQIVKNNTLLALEPLGSAVFGAVGDTMKKAVPYIKDFATGLGGIAAIFLKGDFAGAAATFGWEEDSTQVTVLFKIRDVLGEVKDRAVAALKGFGDYLTGTMIPAAKDFGGWLASNRDWLTSLAVAVGAVVVVWKTYQAALLVVQTYTKIATAVTAAWNAVMALNPIVLIIAAVAALAAGLVYFFTQTETGKRVWGEFTGWLSATWLALTQNLQLAWQNVVTWFTNLGGNLVAAWNNVATWFANLAGNLVGAWSNVGTWFANLWQNIYGAASNVWTALGDFFTGVGDRIRGMFSRVWDLAMQVFSWTPLGLIVTNWDTIVGFFKTLPAKIGAAATGMWDGLTGTFKQAINGLIRMWNDFHLTLGGGRILGMDIPSITLETPNIPYLAKGGDVVTPGWAVVGERGPELVNLNIGARVTPLNERSGASAGNPWAGGVHIDHAELGGSLDELAAEVDWRARR